MSGTIRTMADYHRLVRANRPGHGYWQRLIECQCGQTFPPEKFDEHLREEAKNEMVADMKRTLRRAARRLAPDTDTGGTGQ